MILLNFTKLSRRREACVSEIGGVEHVMICFCNARSRRGGTGQTCSVQEKPQQPTKLPRAKGWRKWPVAASRSHKCLRLCSS